MEIIVHQKRKHIRTQNKLKRLQSPGLVASPVTASSLEMGGGLSSKEKISKSVDKVQKKEQVGK